VRAQVNIGYGDISCLQPVDLPIPVAFSGELLVRVLFAGVNHVDWQMREGRFKDSVSCRFPFVPGWDLSGIVEEVGPDTESSFAAGDSVYAYSRGISNPAADGAYAEYVAVSARSCAAAPAGLPPERLAALPVASLTAAQVMEAARLEPTDRVLVIGAAGAVGRQVLAQLALRRISVIAAAHPGHHAVLGAAGAGEVTDSPTLIAGDRQDRSRRADVVLDCGAGLDVPAVATLVRHGGRFVSIVRPPDQDEAAAAGIAAAHVFSRPDGEGLALIGDLAGKGLLPLPEVDVLELEDAGIAQEKLKAGSRGKICLRLTG
jgi:NADPH:quinone reductase-like Zn-dependent oxidoreductase